MERFLCYIDGKERIIFGRNIKNTGCSNKSCPMDSKPYEFGHNIYFANKSGSWNNQWVAFIDLTQPGIAYGRIYKITEEQFSQIRCQEGRGLNWYGFPQNDFCNPIDIVDGINVYTFTQQNNETKRNLPSDIYKNVIIRGLIEIGLTDQEARIYIGKCENQ